MDEPASRAWRRDLLLLRRRGRLVRDLKDLVGPDRVVACCGKEGEGGRSQRTAHQRSWLRVLAGRRQGSCAARLAIKGDNTLVRRSKARLVCVRFATLP